MEPDMYDKIVHQLTEFPKDGVKRIVFSGLGEPLMNPELPRMIKQVVDANIAGRVEIITNGLLLKPSLSEKLLEAGLTNINISVQGVSAERYLETCGRRIDYEKFVENLNYLFKIRKDTQIYIKAIDSTLKDRNEEKLFYDTFGSISDRIYVEHLIVMQQQMEGLKNVVDHTKNFYNQELDLNRKVCGQSFYFLQIGCDFDTFPCPVPGLPKSLSMGNVRDMTLTEIWNGGKRRKHLRKMLEFKKDTIPACTGCTCFNAINDPSEFLEDDAPRLLKYFT